MPVQQGEVSALAKVTLLVLLLEATRDATSTNALPPLFLQHHAFPVSGWRQRAQEARGVARSR